MIPPDVANSLRLIQPETRALQDAQTQAQSVLPAQRLNDVLSDLIPGQRVLAQIQALLPNGNYRAVVNQRDITLALPFSAKPGDTLELEVSETNGKVALAFVSNRTAASANPVLQDSVSTSLSPAGKLIGDLVGDLDISGKRAPAAPLNGSQPLVDRMPASGDALAPVLKQALTQSGMFYESHQARWVAGELPTEALRQEPQSRFSPPPLPPPLPPASLASPPTGDDLIDPRPVVVDAARQVAVQPDIANREAQSVTSQNASANPASGAPQAHTLQPPAPGAEPRIPQELTPLVRQQLDGLATNNFAWQGQIWPGQNMWWEIGEEPQQNSAPDNEAHRPWQSRLKLDMPSLGGLDATVRLQTNGQISISVTAASQASENRMRDMADQLQQQFEASGLDLIAVQLAHEAAIR